MLMRAFQSGDHARYMGFANVDSMVRAALLYSGGNASLEETYRYWREDELAAGKSQLADGWSQKLPGSDDVWLSEKAVGDLAALSNSEEDRSVIGMLKSLTPVGDTTECGDNGLTVRQIGPHYCAYTRQTGDRLQVARILPNREWFAILLDKFMAGSAN